MLDPSGMLWDDPKLVEESEKDSIYRMYKGMSPSMQKAIKDIMETTQINKEDNKNA